MYLKLSVAGHLTIFLTRTRGPFWSIRPARILWVAVLGTQIVATLIAVYGLFMTPLGWGWAAFVWGYALVWFLVNDRVKLLAYRIFDPVKAKMKLNAEAEPRSATKAEPTPEDEHGSTQKADAEPSSPASAEPKAEAKAPHTPETRAPTDLTSQIARRSYELYEEGGRQDGRAAQDWQKAEREIRKAAVKAEPEATAAASQNENVESTLETEPGREAVSKLEPEATPDRETKAKPAPDAKAKTLTDLTPQLVKRVHQLYEELGRKDVQAVEALEKAKREEGNGEPAK